MTIITRKTTMEVADTLHDGSRKFEFAPTHIGLKVGDIVRFSVMYNKREIPHPVQGDRFRVTCVLNNDPRVHLNMSLVGLEKTEPEFE